MANAVDQAVYRTEIGVDLVEHALGFCKGSEIGSVGRGGAGNGDG